MKTREVHDGLPESVGKDCTQMEEDRKSVLLEVRTFRGSYFRFRTSRGVAAWKQNPFGAEVREA